eukprot:scaffold1054_cov124-Cylindrotheca_fusiformis.AAC.7
MKRQQGGAAKLALYMVILFSLGMTWFLHGKSDLFSEQENNEVALLREKIEEANRRIEELGLEVRHSPNRITGIYKSRVKTMFNVLPSNEDKNVKPLIIQNLIHREGSGLNKTDIVLATQLSTNKLDNMLTQLKYWNGPASIAVYLSSLDDIDRFFNFVKQNRPLLRLATFHVVLEKTSTLHYPTNLMRNVAMDGIESHYFLAMDVDLIPLPGDCYSKLKSTLSRINVASRKKTLFVLPAFHLFPEAKESYAFAENLPMSKSEVVRKVEEHKMDQFWKRFQPGHGPTQYKTWLENNDTSSDFYEIDVTKSQSEFYEPYVAGFKLALPRYWEGTNQICLLSFGPNASYFCLQFLLPLSLGARLSRKKEDSRKDQRAGLGEVRTRLLTTYVRRLVCFGVVGLDLHLGHVFVVDEQWTLESHLVNEVVVVQRSIQNQKPQQNWKKLVQSSTFILHQKL